MGKDGGGKVKDGGMRDRRLSQRAQRAQRRYFLGSFFGRGGFLGSFRKADRVKNLHPFTRDLSPQRSKGRKDFGGRRKSFNRMVKDREGKVKDGGMGETDFYTD